MFFPVSAAEKVWALLVLVTVFTHALWEYAHIGLYTGYEWMVPVLGMCIIATVGDVFYTAFLIGLIGVLKRDGVWFIRATQLDYVALSIFGFIIALAIEYRALALGRWGYTEYMPIIPYLEIGLSPVLQMVVLLPFSIFLTRYALRYIRATD